MKGENYSMATKNKMKFILEDIYDLERQLRDYEDIKEKLIERNKDLDLAIEEYLKSTRIDRKIKKYDRVAVIADHEFEGEIGHVVEIDANHEFPYLLEFTNIEIQKRNQDGLLWKREELEIL